jgi:hypothetical protein
MRTSPARFIARVTTHIPDKGRVMIPYYGLYSNAQGGYDEEARPGHIGHANPHAPISQKCLTRLEGTHKEGL